MEWLTRFAHDGEAHSNTFEQVSHATPWYLALLIALVIVGAVSYLAWLISGRNKGTTLLAAATTLLFVGFASFIVSPVIAATSITLGLIITMFSFVVSNT